MSKLAKSGARYRWFAGIVAAIAKRRLRVWSDRGPHVPKDAIAASAVVKAFERDGGKARNSGGRH